MAHAKVTLTEGMKFKVDTGSGHELTVDAREEVGGTDGGPRPMELLAAGLAGCTAMDVISILRKMQQPVQGLQVRVVTKDAEAHPRRFLSMHIEYEITGEGLDEARVRRAIELSESRYCPATATLRQGTTMTSSYRIVAPQ